MAMSKLDFITIFIVVICIAALGFLVSKTMGVMDADDSTPTVEEVIDNTTIDEADEYDFDDEGNIKDTDDASTAKTGDEDYPVDGDDGSNEDDTETLDFDDEDDDESEDDDDSASQSSSNNGGAYLVLAGSYKEKVNAEIQVRKLQRMGYNNAEVRSFNRGAYAVALVDRFDSYSEAAALKRKLADEGIDVFVKKKR